MVQVRLAKSKKYKEEIFKPIVEKSLSIAGVCREMSIRPVGGNYKTIHYYINLYNIDISHFTGQAWNVGDAYRPVKQSISLDDILVENSTYTSTSSLKKRLLNNNILEYVCVECGIKDWNGKDLSLHLDHVNGNNRDNRLENLRLLCPNCHSQTTTYCNKNNVSNTQEHKKELYNSYKNIIQGKEDKINKCVDCGKQVGKRTKRCKKCYDIWLKEKYEPIVNYCGCGKKIKSNSNHCVDCANKNKIKHDIPPYDELKKELDNTNQKITAEKYGVSRTTIQRWLKFYGKKLKIKYYCECGEEIKRQSKQCIKCSKEKQRKVKDRPTYKQLLLDISEMSYCAIGRKYGVSDNAIRKWKKNYEKDL